jgi:hypothetical protein
MYKCGVVVFSTAQNHRGAVYEIPAKSQRGSFIWIDVFGGTVVAKGRTRTRRVDKGKSGQALKTAVSGGFGGGILSQI